MILPPIMWTGPGWQNQQKNTKKEDIQTCKETDR